ncbi:hypothetical protein D3C75_535020 [compost metagenome]
MPTGVHAALMPAAVGRAGILDDRQRIHVRPYPEFAQAAAIAQDSNHTGLADAGVHFITPLFE